MKKTRSKIAITCFLLFTTVLFTFLLNLFSLSSTSFRTSARTSVKEHLKLMDEVVNQNRSPPPPSQETPQTVKIMCDRSHRAYDICKINGPTVLDPTTSTLYLSNSDHQASNTTRPPHTVEKIRPYPRKWERFTMNRIKELTLTSHSPNSPCQVQHNAPALVFSAGGYTGNFFHDFNDGLIPLFITVNSVYSHDNQDFVLVISKASQWWVTKYADLLKAFSKYPIVNLDNDTATHCFSSAVVGLISHGFMTIRSRSLPKLQSFTHFHALLDKAYSEGQNRRSVFVSSPQTRPRMVLMSRSGSVGRVILNQNEVKKLAEDIGFDVKVFEPKAGTQLRKAYELINSSHAVVGVHGAALTHSVFLRRGAVLLQVVPLGSENVAEICFGNLGRGMGLEYMEYKIGVEESSLMDKYDKNSMLIKDPVAYQGKTWSNAIMSIYLKEQNVRLDLARFKQYLLNAYRKAKIFMDKEG